MIVDELEFLRVLNKTRQRIQNACGEHISPELKVVLYDMLDLTLFLQKISEMDEEDEPEC